MKRLNQKGVTLVELMIATGILAVMATAVISARYYTARQTVRNSEKAFATQKAIKMIEELKTLVSGEEKLGGSTLFDYADGALVNNPILTTDKTVTNPADPLSQNTPFGSGWKFVRRVEIAGLPSDPNGAIVTVRVYRSSDGVGATDELSTVSTVLRTIVSTFPPTQVMDVYILSVANIQGWWAQVPQMKQTFDSILTSLQIENPGLEIRQHYITRTAFGRDPQYAPYINGSSGTGAVAMPSVYFYPGSTTDQNNNPVSYFDPNQLAICGNINVDNTPNYTYSQFMGCPSYSVCDMYNHALRYPDELATYQAVSQAAAAAGAPIPEISERMLIEGMYSQPASFMNAIILNLHGELLPMPAMRNYSDPAKDPGAFPNVRVVTHPENLQYAAGSRVNLRVYSYLDGLSDPTTLDSIPTSSVAQTITLVLPDLGIVPGSLSVTAVVGNDTVNYAKVPLALGASSMGMSWTASNPGGTQTLITLYNTPLRNPWNTGTGGGLVPEIRLYGLEYVPCPIGGNFNQDLTDGSSANNHPKNTARWIISFNVPVANSGQHTLETRVGPTTVTSPPNLSRTYVWVGATPPITEQYQFTGDPRHCPYLDVINNNGYNWYFRTIADGYEGTFTQADAPVTGWGNDKDERDIPRYFSVLRHGLLKSHAIWTTMNGFSYYYMGQGGEFGSDAQPFQFGITFIQKPWSTTGSTAVTRVDEILPNNALMQAARVVGSTDNKWYSKYWLGELYPDALYGTWLTTGNLPTGTGPNSSVFYRAQHSVFTPLFASNPTCSGFQRNLAKRTYKEGCIAFMNATTSGSLGAKTFRHDSATGVGALQTLGNLCYPICFFPLASPVSCTRPWSINFPTSGQPMPTEWGTAPYNDTSLERNSITFSNPNALGNRLFYDTDYNPGTAPNSNWRPFYGSGVLRLSDSASNNAFFILSGLSVQANFGTYELGKSALVFMLRTFLDGGMYTGTPHINQLPLVTLQNPPQAAQLNNPVSQPVSWTMNWKRWGGNVYTEEFPAGWTEAASVTIQYNLKYSNDNGTTWLNVSDNTPTQAGVFDAGHATTATTATWDLSDTSRFPRSNYVLRVEGYRQTTQNFPLHYSYHQTNLYINR